MKKGRGGTYRRDGVSIEVIGNSSDSHGDVLDRGQSAFHLKKRLHGQVLALFTMSGSLILDDGSWTLHSYLQRIHKSDARLGIGYIEV